MPFRVLNAQLGFPSKLKTITCKPEVLYLDVRGRQFVLDVNTLCLVLVDDALRDKIKQTIASGGETGGLLGSKRKRSYSIAFPPTTFVELAVTTDCNLACRYCYEREAVGSKRAYMTEDLAKRALQLLFEGSGGDPRCRPSPDPNQRACPAGVYRVCFFGGEPLLNWPLYETIVPWFREWAKKRGHAVQFSTTTNATELTPERAQFLTRNNFEMIVSLDGPPATHDSWRPFADGRTGSYDATVRGLSNLRDAGYEMKRILLRSTFTGEGVDLVERAQHLAGLVDEGLAGSISIEPSCLSETGCATLPDGHALAFSNEVDKLEAQFRTEYARLANWYVGRVRSQKPIYFHHFSYMLRRLLYGRPAPSECGAARGYLSVNVDGAIYPCHRHHSPPIGSVEGGGVDEELAAPWIDNRWYARKKCPSCPLRNACGGGCRMDSALMCKGDIRKPYAVSCWFKRVFIEESAWIMADLGPEVLAKTIKE